MKIAVRQMPGEPEVDISDCFDVIFGEGAAAIRVMARDGHLEVVAVHGQLIVRPKAANGAWIEREDF